MYYELYIDVFFIINLVMDYLLLRIVNRLLKCSATHFRSLAAAAAGALGACLFVLCPKEHYLLSLILVHGVCNVIMVRIGCPQKGLQKLIRGVVTLYIASFLLGGLLQVVLTYTQIRELAGILLLGEGVIAVGIRTLVFFAAFGYGIITLGIRLYDCLKGKANNIMEVTLHVRDRSVRVKGLYDTGNQLSDMLTKTPVSVLEFEAMSELLTDEEKEKLAEMMDMKSGQMQSDILRPHYILFRTVGNEQGLLLAVTLEKLCLLKEGVEIPVKSPMVALTGDKLSSDKRFQMIINPNIVK